MTRDPLRRVVLLVILLTLALGGIAGVARAATVVANGNYPDAVVDRDGITHVVWNQDNNGSSPDVLHYCQIPRGGTACANAQSFTPSPYASASNNHDFEGPHVFITAFGEVVLLTHRCCGTVVGQADDDIVYTSNDGGATFTGPQALGSVSSGAAAVPTPVAFDGTNRRVLTIAAPTGGIRFQAAPLAQPPSNQPYTTAYAQLSNYNSYDASVVFVGAGHFAAAWADANGTAYFRTYTCTGNPCTNDPNVASSWSAQVSVPNAQLPRLTTGPNGTFLFYRSTTDSQYYTRKIDTTNNSVGPALPVGQSAGSGNARDVTEDANGLLHALFIDKDSGLTYRASADGGQVWGDAQKLVPGPNFQLGDLKVTARTVDDGFAGSAIWEDVDPGDRNPQILMSALPDPSISLFVTPPPGTGGGGVLPAPAPVTPPPPPGACQTLSFAAVDVIADACFTRDGSAYVATGGVKINGLRIELGSGKLKLDPKARTITTSGASVTVKVGDTVLYKAPINWTLPKGSIASLGTIDISGGGALLGFPLKGSIDIKLRGGGVEIPVHLGLPALFGGVTGDVTVRADNVAGVHLRELHVKVGDALIGPLEIKDLFFDYDADKVSWAGGAKVILPPQPPGPSIESKIGFSHGDLDYLSAELTLPPGVFLDPFAVTQLKTIRFSLATKPTLQLKGGITIDAGPKIAGVAAVSVDGDLTFTLGNPSVLRVDGKVSLVSIPLATAFFELRSNGYVGFGGHLGYEYSGFSATADVSGFFFKSAFNAEAKAKICLGDFGCAGGDVVFSSVGFAGCAEIGPLDLGAGYTWGGSVDLMFSGCDVGPFRAKAAAAQAGAPSTVTFPAGLPGGVVAVTGQGAPPHVALVGPGGARIEDTPGAKSETGGSVAFHNPETNTTYFVLKAPAAGTWSVEPAADSVPVTGVQSADGLKDPKITGSVKRGSGRSRVLSYNVTPLPGQKVTFAEKGAAAAAPLGSARDGRGTLRFTPADGPGGTRKIIALVTENGKPRTQLTVATYVAPAPAKPATIKHLAARRSGTKLSVSWSAATNAKRYELVATLSDGRRLRVRQKSTKLSIPAITTKTRATITVTGLKADGTRGKSATVKVAAKKAKTKKK